MLANENQAANLSAAHHNVAVQYELLPVVALGPVGHVARGTMGLEVSPAEAAEAVSKASGYITDVAENEPSTCMDDGEAAGLLNDKNTRPRRKQAGGSAIAEFVGDELTRSRREARGDLHPDETEHQSPLERMRAQRKRRTQDGKPAGAHVRLAGGEESCGCGMADKLPQVQRTIVEEAARAKGDRVAAITAAVMRTDFDHDVHAGVVYDAQRLLDEMGVRGWSGVEFIEGVRHPEPGQPRLWGPSAADEHIEVTAGEHAPVALVIHYGDGTLDRDAYVAETGKKLLWIDERAIWREAEQGVADPSDRAAMHERYQAIMTANIAGGVTLADPHLQVFLVGERPVVPTY